MSSRLLVVSLLLLSAACGEVPARFTDAAAGDDIDAAEPIDGDLGPDAEPVECTAPGTAVCAGDELIACDAGGIEHRSGCPLGCHATEERCVDVAPSNNLGAYLDMTGTAEALTLPDGSQIDTTTGAITTPAGAITVASALVTQVGGPSIRVFVVSAATLDDVTVSGNHALAIVSDGLITVQGRITATGALSVAGPGAQGCTLTDGLGGEGVHPGSSNYNYRGGGGAGFGTAGARGGHVGGTNGGAAGLTTSGAAAVTLTPLRGGCKGGGSQHPDQQGTVNVGGGGGGAIQLVSRTQITVIDGAAGTGVINVGGGGGPAGTSNPVNENGGGGGGGSGGSVLLEAPTVLITGTGAAVAASGGGGGGGCAQAGGNGGVGATAAAGGVCAGNAITAGGAGAVTTFGGGSINPTPGVDSTSAAEPRGAGGGGGATGRVRINNASGAFSLGAGAAIYATTTIGAIGQR